MGNYNDHSNIELAISGSLLNVYDILNLSEALDALDLPWEIELIGIETLDDDALREHIENCGIVID